MHKFQNLHGLLHSFLGYVSSKNGPKWSDEALEELQGKIRQNLNETEKEIAYKFHGEDKNQVNFAE